MKKFIFLFVVLFLFSQITIAQNACARFEWTNYPGGNGINSGNAIAMDSLDNIYVTGFFQDSIIFGNDTIISKGQKDIFVAKLDANSNYIWVKGIGGTKTDSGNGISLDNEGNIFLIGSFNDTVQFGNELLVSNGNQNGFIAKLNNNGDFLWVKPIGNQSGGSAIATDSIGNSYITGYFNNGITYDGITRNGNGSFVLKIDTNGDLLWMNSGGGLGRGISFDKWENSYITGYFQGSAKFGDTTIYNPGTEGLFIAKLDSTGNFLWARTSGGNSEDQSYAISTDPEGNSYITGNFFGTAIFGNSTLNIGNTLMAGFLAKINTNGDFLWGNKIGKTAYNYGYGVYVDKVGNGYVTGMFHGSENFGNTTLTSNGGLDIFVAKFDTTGNYLWAKSAGGSQIDQGNGIIANPNGDCFVTGEFIKSAVFDDTTFNGTNLLKSYAFVTKIRIESDSVDFSYSTNDLEVQFGNIEPDFNVISWDFGDSSLLSNLSNPTYTYSQDGTYLVTLTVEDACGNLLTKTKEIILLTSNNILENNFAKIYPNPTNNQLTIESKTLIKTVRLWDLNGRLLENKDILQNTAILDLEKYKKGIYLVEIVNEKSSFTEKIIKN